MLTSRDYVRDGAEIYRRSFAIIRGEADLARFSRLEERVAVRVIHACGLVEAAADILFSPGAVEAGVAALAAGAPVLCDARMVADGVTRARLPAGNEVVCTLTDPRVADLAPLKESALLPDMNVKTAMTMFERAEAETLAVVDTPEDRRVVGVLTEAFAARRYAAELDRASRGALGD